MKKKQIHCPYCGAKASLRPASAVYGTATKVPDSYLYVCDRYPRCDSYVGAHKRTKEPMGTLANGDLRNKRIQAHKAFDWMWKSGLMTKWQAYKWMQGKLALTDDHRVQQGTGKPKNRRLKGVRVQMKNLTLNSRQQRLVEENLSVVRHAIHKNIIVNDSLYGFEYDDLYQEGCIWLCKAAISFDETRNIKFATYAEKVVTNGLRTYCRLMCGKQKHHISLPVQSEPEEDGLSMEQLSSADDTLDRLLEEQDICMLLQNCKRQYAGTARLGIEAIEWKVKGLSGAEIAKMYGVKPNLVGAWISRAAGRLKQNRDFMQYFDRPVEMDSS